MARSHEDRWGKATGRRKAQPAESVEVAPEASEAGSPEDQPNELIPYYGGAGLAKEQLKSFIERIERLEEEKKTIADDIKDVFAEAKGNGFDTKALRAILRMRREDPDERAEHEAIVDLYMQALGMIPFEETPLARGGEG